MSLTPEALGILRSHQNRERRQWEKALGHQTGPRSAEGKRASAMRSLKHGARSAGTQALQRWLASVNRMIRQLERRAKS